MSARRLVLLAALALLAMPSAAQAAFPGVNGKIMLATSPPQTINPDGTGEAPAVAGGEWSADGSRIVFTRCNPTCHIWVIRTDGTSEAQVTNGTGEERPTWAPDGDRIAFMRSTTELWVVNSNGTGETLVAGGLRDMFDSPSWSPDGSKILFSSDDRLNLRFTRELYTVHPDGTGRQRLNTATSQECDAFPDDTSGADWSPDGTRISYHWQHGNGDGECDGNDALHVMNADGTGDHEIVGYYIAEPIEGKTVWSPDGNEIAYDGQAGTFVVSANGGPEQLVTWDGSPIDWQPLPQNYARPRGAKQFYASLVPAYSACTSSNAEHGAPLSFSSCGPPSQSSGNLTLGTPDANGRAANSFGFVRLVVHGTPGGADDSDVSVSLSVSSVYRTADLSDYAGELEARMVLRLTDKESGVPSTVLDTPLSFVVPCAPTAAADTGATCTLETTADAVRPGLVPEGRRSLWQLGQAQIYDGGTDEVAATTGDNELFEMQGVFVP